MTFFSAVRSKLSKPASLIAVFGVLALASLPTPAFAQAGAVRLLPECALTLGGCGVCDLLVLLGNLSEFLLDIVSVAVLLAVIIGGLYWLFSFGNAERVDRGKQILMAAFIGLGFVMGGFVLVNFVLATLTGSAPSDIVRPFGNTEWNQFCEDKQQQVADPNATSGAAGTTGQTPASASCAAAKEEGLPCSEGSCTDRNNCACTQDPSSANWVCETKCVVESRKSLLPNGQFAMCVTSSEYCTQQVSGILAGSSTRTPGSATRTAPFTCTNNEFCCIVPTGAVQGLPQQR